MLPQGCWSDTSISLMNPHFKDLSRSSSHLHNQVEIARWSASNEKCDQTKTKEYNIVIVIDL